MEKQSLKKSPSSIFPPGLLPNMCDKQVLTFLQWKGRFLVLLKSWMKAKYVGAYTVNRNPYSSLHFTKNSPIKLPQIKRVSSVAHRS